MNLKDKNLALIENLNGNILFRKKFNQSTAELLRFSLWRNVASYDLRIFFFIINLKINKNRQLDGYS